MNNISCKIIADSISPFGHRLTTFVLVYPRIIHAELMTHRLFSRNAASSRAIPVRRMIKLVKDNMFIPMAIQKAHVGMQGSEYFEGEELKQASQLWVDSAESALQHAEKMEKFGITKQIINRILEPYQYYQVILTASEFDNFFELRCPKYMWSDEVYHSKKDMQKVHPDSNMDYATTEQWLMCNKGQSEIHMMQLAECMWDARNESIPKSLKEGEWHIPFGDNITDDAQIDKILESWIGDKTSWSPTAWNFENLKIKVATARCARVSYLNFEGKDDYEADIKLYDTLLTSGHYSPFEHCARVMTDIEYVSYTQTVHHKPGTPLTDVSCGVREGQIINDFVMERQENYGWCRNFRGFIQLRELI